MLSKLELMGEKVFKNIWEKEKIKCGFKLQQKQKIMQDFVASCMKRSSEVQKIEVIKQ